MQDFKMCMLKGGGTYLANEVHCYVALNSRLKISIFECQLTNKELALRIGISPQNMSAIVNGAIPHLRTAQKIVRALNSTGKVNVTIDELWPLPEEDE